MTRIVVLSFDDNKAAEAFVEHILDAQDPMSSDTQATSIGYLAVALSVVEAVVARPTVSCRCRIVGMTEYFRNQSQRRRSTGKFEDPGERREYVTAMGRWTKTERFGWLVHDKCKPSELLHRSPLHPEHADRPRLQQPTRRNQGEAAMPLPRPEASTGGNDMVQPLPVEGVPVQPTELPEPSGTEDEASLRS